MAISNGEYEKQFTHLYQTLVTNVTLISNETANGRRNKKQVAKAGRRRVPWMDKNKFIIRSKIRRAIAKGALILPLAYQDMYVKPLRENLSLVFNQSDDRLIENLVGAVYDQADNLNDRQDDDELQRQGGNNNPLTQCHHLSHQIQQVLAVISSLYRKFLAAEVRNDFNLRIENWLPPLATFQYETTLLDGHFAPSILTADEAKLLFGSSVGVVVLPSTYRSHPLLWGSLAHEVGGHDVLKADSGLLTELEEGVYDLFEGEKAKETLSPDNLAESDEKKQQRLTALSNLWEASDQRSEEFKKLIEREPDRVLLGQLWRYWINEAAADIYGILNMGPAFALCTAIYTAVLNKQLNPSLQQAAKDDLKDAEADKNRDLEIRHAKRAVELKAIGQTMQAVPILRASPPPPMGDLDTHPSDVLRLWMMIGAIENLNGEYLQAQTKKLYVELIEKTINLCTTDEQNGTRQRREDMVKIRGNIQISSDIWRTVTKPGDENLSNPGFREIPLDHMKVYAREVGRYVVTEHMKALNGLSIQQLVTWDDHHERIATTVRDRLLGEGQADIPGSICNIGSAAQVLAGATMAALEKPELYSKINRRLAEALQDSYQRDEVWGDPVLSRIWSSPRKKFKRTG